MKKFLMISLAAMACLSFSCSKDNTQKQEEEETTVKDKTPASAEITFTYYATEDMLNFADMTVTYGDGTVSKTETVTGVEWTATIASSSLPVTFQFDRTVTKKEGFELLSTQNYTYSKQYKFSYRILNAAGEEIDDNTYISSVTPRTLPGDKIQQLFDGGKMGSTHSITITKEGRCPQIELPE